AGDHEVKATSSLGLIDARQLQTYPRFSTWLLDFPDGIQADCENFQEPGTSMFRINQRPIGIRIPLSQIEPRNNLLCALRALCARPSALSARDHRALCA